MSEVVSTGEAKPPRRRNRRPKGFKVELFNIEQLSPLAIAVWRAMHIYKKLILPSPLLYGPLRSQQGLKDKEIDLLQSLYQSINTIKNQLLKEEPTDAEQGQ